MNPFSIGGFFATVQAKLIAFGLIALVCLGVYLKMRADHKEIVKLEVANGTQVVTIATQGKTIVDDEKVADIREDTNVAFLTDVKVAEKKHHAIEKKVEQSVAVIEQKFDELPKTPENAREKFNQLSQTNIDSVWEAFCAAAPNANECPTPQSQGDGNA